MKTIVRFVAALAVVSLLAAVAAVHHARTFDDLKPAPAPCGRPHPGFHVSLLGDSWVAAGKLDRPIVEAASIEAPHLQHFGFPGATSRDLYRALRANPAILACIDALVVVGGVIDTSGHRGSDFYSHHVLLIARLAISARARPFIVAVPRYDLAHEPFRSPASFFKRQMFRILFDGPDPISEYRQALRERLIADDLTRAVTVIDPPAFTPDQFENPLHLNDKGYPVLGRAIGQAFGGHLAD